MGNTLGSDVVSNWLRVENVTNNTKAAEHLLREKIASLSEILATFILLTRIDGNRRTCRCANTVTLLLLIEARMWCWV